MKNYCVHLGPLRSRYKDRITCARGNALERKGGRGGQSLRQASDCNGSLMLSEGERKGNLNVGVLNHDAV